METDTTHIILKSRIPQPTCNYIDTPEMSSELFRALAWHDHIQFKGDEVFEQIMNKCSRERRWVVYATRYRLCPRHVRSVGKMYPKIAKLIKWITDAHTTYMLTSPPEPEYHINYHWDTDREASWDYAKRIKNKTSGMREE